MGRGTERVKALLAELGNPERTIPVIHIAGTNGKGSTAAMIAAALTANGARTGMFTSPSPDGLTPSILVDDAPVATADIDAVFTEVAPHLDGADGPTAFEVETALALGVFRRLGVEVAVVEAGLGGEGDATNVFDAPLATVITNVEVDHAAFLGDDVGQIAVEKAGILRTGVPCITAATGDAQDVVSVLAGDIGAPLTVVGEDARAHGIGSTQEGSTFTLEGAGGLDGPYTVSLPGAHQVTNAVTALATLAALPVALRPSRNAATAGLASARVPARLEWVKAKKGDLRFLLDGAHNPAAMTALASFIEAQGLKPALLFGVLQDKDHIGMVDVIAPHVSAAVVTRPASPRARHPMDSAREFSRNGTVGTVVEDLDHAIGTVIEQARESGVVLVTGSFYLAAAVRRRLHAVI